ncbi:hypothetical protein FQZ97_1177630 [compost metagenome]
MHRRQRQMTQIEQKHQQHGKTHQGSGALVEVAKEQRNTGHQQHHHWHDQHAQETGQKFRGRTVFALP